MCGKKSNTLSKFQETSRIGKKQTFVNHDFLGIQIWRKKRVNFNNLKSQQNCVHHKFGKNLVSLITKKYFFL